MTKPDDLVDRLRAATGPDRELDAEIAKALEGVEIQWRQANYTMDLHPVQRYPSTNHIGGYGIGPVPYYTASVDAALSLVERCLPGQQWMLDKQPENFECVLWDGVTMKAKANEAAPTLPLAILTALLTAMQAERDAA